MSDQPAQAHVKTFDVPPEGSNLKDFSAEQLSEFGIDLNDIPDWLLGDKQPTWIRPEFSPRAVRRPERRQERHGPPPNLSPLLSFSTPPNVEINDHWSGAIIPGGQGGFGKVAATWIVPSVEVPQGAPPGQYVASSWIGLDGDYGSGDVLQSGYDGLIASGMPQPRYLHWYEWFPGQSQYTNIPVSPGDDVACVISLQAGPNGPGTGASIYTANRTKNVATTFQVGAATGRPLKGNCAEWIVEAHVSGGDLANFSSVSFQNCCAWGAAGQVWVTNGGHPIFMVRSGRVFSSAIIVQPAGVNVLYS